MTAVVGSDACAQIGIVPKAILAAVYAAPKIDPARKNSYRCARLSPGMVLCIGEKKVKE